MISIRSLADIDNTATGPRWNVSVAASLEISHGASVSATETSLIVSICLVKARTSGAPIMRRAGYERIRQSCCGESSATGDQRAPIFIRLDICCGIGHGSVSRGEGDSRLKVE